MKCYICSIQNEITNTFCTSCGNKLIEQKNPTKKHEIVVKIVNCFLMIPYTIAAFLLAWLFFSLFILGLGASKGTDIDLNNYFTSGMKVIFILVLISSIIILAFNIVTGILMYRKNKKNKYIGKFKKIKKIAYLLLVFFLGDLGIHRFMVGDKKDGIIRLILSIGAPFLAGLISGLFTWPINFAIYIIPIPMVIVSGLKVSDFVIGLSKVSDENKMIEL